MTDQPLDLEQIRDHHRRACAEMDRLTNGNPGTNWRWSIPANPDRDSDLILSLSVGDVPRLIAEIERLQGRDYRTAVVDEGGCCVNCTQYVPTS